MPSRALHYDAGSWQGGDPGHEELVFGCSAVFGKPCAWTDAKGLQRHRAAGPHLSMQGL